MQTEQVMRGSYFETEAQYALDYCTKYLNRFNRDPRHAFTDEDKARPGASVCDAWRFPLIDSYGGGADGVADPASFSNFNQVTFVYSEVQSPVAGSVGVVGTFNTLYEVVPLRRVSFAGEPTSYWAASFAVPKGQMHRYRLLVDGVWTNDPINPQTLMLPSGRIWSRFFTEACSENLALEEWEQSILRRLVGQILPFRTTEGERFLTEFYTGLDNADEKSAHAYRFDESVGEVGFIDDVLAREEHHRLRDYKICLTLIDRVLRQRVRDKEPADMPEAAYDQLYQEMSADHVDGWDAHAYNSPLFFLNLLRRHAATGAFSHPKHGGNAAGAGWAYLEERYRAADGTSLFKWRDALEPPLGTNANYRG